MDDRAATAHLLQTQAEAVLMREAHPLHHGEAMVVTIYRLVKGASLYQRGNDIVDRLAQECLYAIHRAFFSAPADTLEVEIGEQTCWCNHRRVRLSAETLANYKAFIQFMHTLGIGSLAFKCDVTAKELIEFAFAVKSLDRYRTDNAVVLTEQLIRRGVSTVQAGGLETGEVDRHPDETASLKRKSKEVYFSTINVIRESLTHAAHGHELELRKVKRLMMSSVNLILHEESSLLGLANIKSFDDYTFSHSVNVAIYSLALGQRVGLPKSQLYHLGICGLFHDVGKMSIPKTILNKPGPLTPQEWEIVQMHTTRGAELALRNKQWNELTTRILATTFEHHIKFDGSGYPALAQPRRTSLFSRIITIADCYDALSRPRVYRNMPYVSEKILGMLLAQSGADFDPLLVKLFINMVGLYPLGALVLLNTNQLGIVTKISDVPEMLDRPQVRLLHRQDTSYVNGDTIDLTTIDPETGSYRWSILETLDPNDYGIPIEECYL